MEIYITGYIRINLCSSSITRGKLWRKWELWVGWELSWHRSRAGYYFILHQLFLFWTPQLILLAGVLPGEDNQASTSSLRSCIQYVFLHISVQAWGWINEVIPSICLREDLHLRFSIASILGDMFVASPNIYIPWVLTPTSRLPASLQTQSSEH